MYSREISTRDRHDEPSFSSTLLDEIDRSMDDNTEDSKFFYGDRHNLFKCQANYNSCSHRVEDEQMAGEKWMLKHENLTKAELLYLSSDSTSDHLFSSSTTKPRSVPTGREELDDYKMGGGNILKSKSRALKLYASLRKVKQPISPGGKLTSFINSLFNNHASEKKLKNNVDSNKSMEASSARSCLSNNSRERMRNGIQRRVRFDPVSVVFNEESRSTTHSNPSMDALEFRPRSVEKDCSMSYGFRKNSDDDDSDSSSDLFELDHLSLFGHNRFCQQLPIFETTRYGTNRSGLI